MEDNGSTYYTNKRPEMLKYIPADTRVLLDVGCGEGSFSREFKKKGITVWGIEPVVSAAETAANQLDHVLQGSIEDRMKDLPDHHFDCIIFNDVLEHLLEPEQVLTGMKKKLTEKGCIVCSIPNVRNWRNIRKLLINKDWKYEDSGTLDRTHFRFFTLKSLKRMFADLEFDILKLDGINRTKSPWFHVFNLLFLFTASDTKYLQFACVIKPKKKVS